MTGEKASGNAQETVFGEVRRNWGWLLGLGIIFVILGIIGLGMTFAVTMASVMMFGVLLLVGAGAQFVDAPDDRRDEGAFDGGADVNVADLHDRKSLQRRIEPLDRNLDLLDAGAAARAPDDGRRARAPCRY